MTTITCPHCQGHILLRTPTAFTRKQRQCLVFIRDYMIAHRVAPAFEEIKRGLALGSKSGVHRLITGLEDRGAIVRMHERARALEISAEALAAINDDAPFFNNAEAKTGHLDRAAHVSAPSAHTDSVPSIIRQAPSDSTEHPGSDRALTGVRG